jgi:hypothetical protein
LTLELKRFGIAVTLVAGENDLSVTSSIPIDWTRPESWPTEALEQGSGRRTAFEVASLLEMGLATVENGAVKIPYENFPEIETEEFRLTTAFAPPSPFLLKIDRTSDIGRGDFRYRYQYLILAFWSGPAVEVNFGPPGRVLATLRGWGNESVAG